MAKVKPESTTDRGFEESLARLEEIVSELEAGEVPLERAIALFEEGVKLGKTCSATLDDAERKITILLQQADGATTEAAFDPDAAAAPSAPAAPPRAAAESRRKAAKQPSLLDDDDDDSIPF
jgi:exodeoxyribonuclease VII small subunit